MTPGELATNLQTDLQDGLGDFQSQQRLKQYGVNRLETKERFSPWKLFFSEFADFMVLVLLGAVVISVALGEWHDAITILAIIFLNSVLGFVQEYRAERSLEALRELSAPKAHVVRAGKQETIPACQVVPGDLVLVEAGYRVPADLRLVEGNSLEVDESPLTGESIPVPKEQKAIATSSLELGDRKNMLFAGTTITRGRGRGVVVATGMDTELGKIAGMLAKSEAGPTPLQQRLDHLGKILVFICVGICLVVAISGLARGENFRLMFLSAVSLAVAAIPEGLPAIVTIALALGVQRMIKRSVIIRRLPAVETLGCATVICSDKTGTLTQNQMMVTACYFSGEHLEVTGNGFNPSGQFFWRGNKIPPLAGGSGFPDHQGLKMLFSAGFYCNNADLRLEDQTQQWRLTGDPTEGALLALGLKAGLERGRVKRLAEIDFTSERKRMAVLVEEEGRRILYLKGAADVLLERSTKIRWAGQELPLQTREQQKVTRAMEAMARRSLRVLALAYRPMTPTSRIVREEDEEDLVFLGLVGIKDPVRPGVKEAISLCRRAGIRTVMITGDFPVTARAIGEELGLLRPDGLVLTGKELDTLSQAQLKKIIDKVDIYARVNPYHKLTIVKALKEQGEVVAMTGDGVNDAPAVKEADIGVAMGIMGTDVTKEASAMIITDDNFASIVAAIEEGRGIYSNIRKFIRYLLGCNIGEIFTMFMAIVTGSPFPLLPIQILWINLVTDGLPAIALGVEPVEQELMHEPPRPPQEGIFSRGLGYKVLIQGVSIGLITLGVFIFALKTGANLVTARTMAFSTLVFSQLSYVFACRSETQPLVKMRLTANPYLLGAVAVSGMMQFMVVSNPFARKLFQTTALSLRAWGIVFFGAICSVLVAENVSWIGRFLKRKLS
ncbi:MAG TPA: cation-translocating P-type ATPase [Firmicutes bacterium]|jgi:Ca2+-transporting ATPase|nr:cation-translocating P-type ATPase [Bacillota bacterium]